MQFNPFQRQSFPVSLSQPTALGPTSPSLQLLAALFQNPVRLKGQHSIFLREKLDGRGKGCRVSMGPGSVRASQGRGQLSLLHFPWSHHPIPMVVDAEGDTIRVHPHSSLQPHLLSKPSPKPRGGAQSCAPLPSCPGGVGLHSHPGRCCILPALPHAAEAGVFRPWISSTLHFHASLQSAPHKLPAAFAGTLAGLPR